MRMRSLISVMMAAVTAIAPLAIVPEVLAAEGDVTEIVIPSTIDTYPRGIDTQTWDEDQGTFVQQRLIWSPLGTGSGLTLQYIRNGQVAVDATVETRDGMFVFDGIVAGNALRIERSLSGLEATDDFLRVWINGTLVPAYGDWFLEVWSQMQSVSIQELQYDFMTEEWVNEAMALLYDPDNYVVVSKEFGDLLALLQSVLQRYMGQQGNSLNCWGCALGILSHIGGIIVAVAAGAPSGGLALAAWLLARYATIAGTIASCVGCAQDIKAALEKSATCGGMTGETVP
ncbi:MAG: hypothetical protein D6738_11390 [Acidobacteria bacterium]|nr:MAG: hypothetical protein D6738_11390 [Acidobacteriota bacterium]